MNRLDEAFQAAIRQYPHGFHFNYSTWQLVDAVEASFYTPDRAGMLVLQENRQGCRTPFNHWGFMIAKSEAKQLCPFCQLLGAEQNAIDYDEPAFVGDVRSCGWCALVAKVTKNEKGLLKSLAQAGGHDGTNA